MTYMFAVSMKQKYVGNGMQIPAGLSVRVSHDQMSSPLYSMEGKKRIAQAFMQQCGLNLSRCSHIISTAYMDSRKL